MHLNYETIETYKKCIVLHAPLTNKGDSVNYRVEKMRSGKIDSKTAGKSVIHYNHAITIEGIPAEAYEYVVNGKSPPSNINKLLNMRKTFLLSILGQALFFAYLCPPITIDLL